MSDIDLALDAGKPLKCVDVGEARDMLVESNIPYTVEIVDFHRAPEKMKQAIKEEGVLWKT